MYMFNEGVSMDFFITPSMYRRYDRISHPTLISILIFPDAIIHPLHYSLLQDNFDCNSAPA